MTKTGHKRFLKKEKARVKLKGSKTLLPKGQNVTDTSFKVKKLVVKEQLKTHAENEIVTKKRHQNIKELLCKLTHYNAGVREESLSGLKELTLNHPSEVLGTNLPLLLESTAQLLVDRKKDVREEAIKLLSGILRQVSVTQLTPLFPVLSSYLACGMTHIEPRVQEDSLKLLDILLATTPELTSQNAYILLPHFLDLISYSGAAGRSLSLRLEGKMTAEKWRSCVLVRLRKLFAAMLEYNKKGDLNSEGQTVTWDHEKYVYLSLYPRLESNKSLFTNSQDKTSNKLEIKDYVEVLMPLLLDTFVEAVPQKKEDSHNAAHLIPADAAALLQCVVDIIFLLWQLLQQSDNAIEHTEWFRTNYSQLISMRFINDRFPYATTLYGIKRKNDASFLMTLLEAPKDADTTCLQQNLGLCHLVFLLSDPVQDKTIWDVCISFLNNCLRVCDRLQQEECMLLKKCFQEACYRSGEEEARGLLNAVAHVWLHQSKAGVIEHPLSKMEFDFLCHVALQPSLNHLHSEKFNRVLDLLPSLLCKPQVSYSLIEIMNKIATRNITIFSISLDSWIETILDNVVSLEVTGCESQIAAKRLVINLLYWVKEWDQDMVNNLESAVANKFFGAELTQHLLDTLQLRLEYDDGNVVELFKDIPRWKEIIP